jgi:predicted ribosome quality control (RQC) complex YloA/Tae2 family protein
MIKNYFFLNRFVVELSGLLDQFTLAEAFSQEKDKIILVLKRNNEQRFIEINVNPGFPYINLRDKYYRAKKNTISFFHDRLSSRFTGCSIAVSDRLLKLSFQNFNIYFAIRGKFTNVVLIDNENKFELFKKYDECYIKRFIDEISNTEFVLRINNIKIETEEDEHFLENVKKKYPIIGKEILNEFIIREKPTESKAELLVKLIKEAVTDNPSVRIDPKFYEISLLPENFYKTDTSEIRTFNTCIESFNYYIYKYYQLEEIRTKSKLINRHISKELTRLSSKINNLKVQIEKGSREEEYKKFGNLLLINLNKIHQGMEEVELDDVYTDAGKLKIKIDPVLSPKQNTDRYFEKARNDRVKIIKSKELFTETEVKYKSMQKINKLIESTPSLNQLNDIMKQLKIKEKDQPEHKEDISQKFKQYLINNKYRVFVGKDSKNNDLLTTKFAKQNDYWFHARSVSGSHVVLRVENTKEAVPKDVLKKAASLAAYHSKAKTAGLVPVSYCFKKYVVKKKGMPAGQVALLKEETFLVRPEIPDKCEFVSQ